MSLIETMIFKNKLITLEIGIMRQIESKIMYGKREGTNYIAQQISEDQKDELDENISLRREDDITK